MSTTRKRALFATLAGVASAAVLAALAGPVGAAPQAGPVLARWTPPPTQFPTQTPSPGQATGPSNLRVTAISPTSVTLAWDAAVPGNAPIRDYTVGYYSPYGGSGATVPVGNVTTATLTGGITGGSQLIVSVYAVDTENHQSTSTTLMLITPVATSGDVVPPSSPGDVRETSRTSTGVHLTWTPATDNVGVVAYDVYQYSDSIPMTVIATTTGTSVFAPVIAGRPFPGLIFVRARDAAGNISLGSNGLSAPVVSASATPSSAPPVSPSPSVSPSPPASAPQCTTGYHTLATWPGGFIAEVTVTNGGTTTIRDWSLSFTYGTGQRITHTWNAAFTQTGRSVVLTGTWWNRDLPPGAAVTAGIVGSSTSAPAPPTDASLNGAACTVRPPGRG